MPNPLSIDGHAHICTEETMNLLNKAAPKVGSGLKEFEKDIFEWSVAGMPIGRCRAAASTSSSASRT